MPRLSMILWLVIAMPFFSIGQRSNNWCFGFHCGLNFNQSPVTPFKSAVYGRDSFNATSYPQTVSDCKGNLLLYTGGDYIWNREHKLLPSSKNLARNNDNNMFLPSPNDDSLYYLFQAYNDSFYFSYLLIDLRQDSGRGDVIKRVKISDSIGSFGGFIKHANDTDYWILISTSAYTIHAYLLTQNGLSKKPVSSPFKGGLTGGNFPYMRSSNNGRFIISMGNQYDFKYKYYIYEFDKSTGKVLNPRPLILKTDTKNWKFSFSPNDSILYGIRNIVKDSLSINQIPTYSNQPYQNINEVFKLRVNDGHGDSQLGPDNRLYVDAQIDTTGYSLFHWSKTISYIPYPDKWGSACGFIFDGVHFNFDSVGVFSQKFPCNSFPVKRINNKFEVTGNDNCAHDYDKLNFKADADSAFKSYNWYFGDGDSATGKSVVHQYKNAGSYYVRLGCELGNCGYMQWVGDSVTIKFKPNIALTDTSYYTCGQYHVQTKVLYKYCDTINLHLGDYDTILYTNNSGNINTFLYNKILDTNGSYLYYAAAKNKDCYDSVGLQHIVNIEPTITPYFTPNYTQSCGNSTITLTDSSGGMDSIIQQRKWTVYYPNNIVKQYDTASTNKLKLIVQDTSYYNAKLVYITKQGCMDSLTKTNVFRILPQPVVYIDSPSHNPLCFGDSFILTAKQKDINYPPLVKYKWNAGQVATPSIKVDTANSYYVSATNAYGCGAQSNTVKLSFLPQLFVNIKKNNDSLYTIATRPIVSYTWYKDTVFYNNTSSLYHPPTGRYTVHVVDGNGCVANSSSLLHIGIMQVTDMDNMIRVYPNPTSDILYIEWSSVLVGNGSTSLTTTNQRKQRNIVMYDILGKKVYNTITNGEGIYSISIGHLAKGLYILSVGSEKIKLAIE